MLEAIIDTKMIRNGLEESTMCAAAFYRCDVASYISKMLDQTFKICPGN